jgi:CelD/BcsL family acetyltransferase involved in cellulose biosynthesis
MTREDLCDSLEPFRADWVRLARVNGNIFATWEWNELWWRHFGRGRRLRVSVSRDDAGEIATIVPLYLWSERPLRVLRFVGHGHGDMLGPIGDARDRAASVASLRRTLGRERYDVFVGDWVGADNGSAEALGAKVLRETGYPILRFEADSWQEFLASRHRAFRKRTGNAQRRLFREHDASMRMTDRTTLAADLDILYRLHHARFGGHEGCYFCGANEPFQREFAALALANDWLRLWILEVDGRPVAAEYGFRFGDSHFAYQCGRDPAMAKASVGYVLEVMTMQEALAEGVREYRFLQGAEPYKYRFATEDPELETIVVAATARGRVAVAGAVAARRVGPLAAILKRVVR